MDNNSGRFTGQVAIVTGAARALVLKLRESFAGRGWVVLNDIDGDLTERQF